MAVITVEELFGPGMRGGTSAIQSQRTYFRTYRARTDTAGDTPATVIDGVTTATGIGLWSSYPGGVVKTYATSFSAEPASENDPYEWRVRIEYTYRDGVASDNPSSEYPGISWGRMQLERIIEKDKDGNPLRNSAGDRYDPVPSQTENYLTLRIQRNLLTTNADRFDPWIAHDIQDSVNSANITVAGFTIEARDGLMIEFDAEWHRRESWSYYTVTNLIAIKYDTWDRELLDAGFRYLVGGVLKDIKIDGQVVTTPKLLDGSGGVLADGGTPVFRTVKTYKEKDWSVLALPSALPSI